MTWHKTPFYLPFIYKTVYVCLLCSRKCNFLLLLMAKSVFLLLWEYVCYLMIRLLEIILKLQSSAE